MTLDSPSEPSDPRKRLPDIPRDPNILKPQRQSTLITAGGFKAALAALSLFFSDAVPYRPHYGLKVVAPASAQEPDKRTPLAKAEKIDAFVQRLGVNAEKGVAEIASVFAIGDIPDHVRIIAEKQSPHLGQADDMSELAIRYLKDNPTAPFVLAFSCHDHPPGVTIALSKRNPFGGYSDSAAQRLRKSASTGSEQDFMRFLIASREAINQGVSPERLVFCIGDPHGVWIMQPFSDTNHAARALPTFGPPDLYSKDPSKIHLELERIRRDMQTIHADLKKHALERITKDEEALIEFFKQTPAPVLDSDFTISEKFESMFGRGADEVRRRRLRLRAKAFLQDQKAVSELFEDTLTKAWRQGQYRAEIEPYGPIHIDGKRHPAAWRLFHDKLDDLKRYRATLLIERRLIDRSHELQHAGYNRKIMPTLLKLQGLLFKELRRPDGKLTDDAAWAAAALQYAGGILKSQIDAIEGVSADQPREHFTRNVEATFHFKLLQRDLALRLRMQVRYVAADEFASFLRNPASLKTFLHHSP